MSALGLLSSALYARAAVSRRFLDQQSHLSYSRRDVSRSSAIGMATRAMQTEHPLQGFLELWLRFPLLLFA